MGGPSFSCGLALLWSCSAVPERFWQAPAEMRDCGDVQVMEWITEYQDTLRELGLEEEDLQFPAGKDRGSALLTEKYISRMEATVTGWFTNILEVCCNAT